MTVDAVAAAGHPAGQEHLASKPRTGGSSELRQIRAATLAPPRMMTQAQAPTAGRSPAIGHLTQRPAEYRISRIELHNVSSELRPDHGHQFPQQPGIPGAFGCHLGRFLVFPPHSVTSASSLGMRVALSVTRTRFRWMVAFRK